MTGTENQKINGLEKKVTNMESKLEEFPNLLKMQKVKSKVPRRSKPANSVSHDKEQLAFVKATPSKSVLVVKNTEDSTTNDNNRDEVERTT